VNTAIVSSLADAALDISVVNAAVTPMVRYFISSTPLSFRLW
jgi:hypothetical protein